MGKALSTCVGERRILVSQTITDQCARAFSVSNTAPKPDLTHLAAHTAPPTAPLAQPNRPALSRRLVFRQRFISLDEQRSGAAHRLDNDETLRFPQEQPLKNTHAGLWGDRRRAKEEAALGGRPEDTSCVVRVVTARDQRGALLHIASRRAIGLRLARGKPPVLVRLEADLRDKGCKRGQLVVAEEGRDGHLRRLLALVAMGRVMGRVGHGLEGEVRAVVAVFGGKDRMQLAAR
eukprot:scaffold3678_cov94-Phaeocystis_antarctica.AAC.1